MPNSEPQALSTKQTYIGATIALVLAGLGLWLGTPTPSPETDVTSPALDRREVERGRIHIREGKSRNLSFLETDMSGKVSTSTTYVPFSGEGVAMYDSSTHRHRGKPIKTTLLNAQIAKKNLPRGQRTPSKKDSGLDELTNLLSASSSSWPQAQKRSKRPLPSPSPSLRPSATSIPTLDSDAMPYPPPHQVAHIGLSQAWDNNREALVYLYDEAGENAIGVCLQISTKNCIWPADFAQSRSFLFRGEQGLRLPGLNLAILPSNKSFAPLLASKAPDIGERLATSGTPTYSDSYSQAQVVQKLSGGLLTALCPLRPSFNASPLFNANGELSGIVLGTSPGYRGHNHHLVADTSLLYAWEQQRKQPSDSEVYDIGFQVDRQLDAILARLSKRPEHTGQQLSLNTQAVPGKRLGNFRLGIRRNYIEEMLGEGTLSSYDLQGQAITTGSYLFSYYVYPELKLACNYYKNRLVAIETTNTDYHTAKGLGPGTDFYHSHFSHELSKRNCTGFTEQDTPLIVAPGLEVELDTKGIVNLLRITI